MRSMAREAALLRSNGFVRESGFLPFFLMAVKTEFARSLREEARILRGMGLVTRIAPSFFERRMGDRRLRALWKRGVAVPAEFVLLLEGQERPWRTGRLMASIALGRGHGIVHAGP